jgi:hypothetical protein
MVSDFDTKPSKVLSHSVTAHVGLIPTASSSNGQAILGVGPKGGESGGKPAFERISLKRARPKA